MKIKFRVGDKANSQVLKSVIDVANSKTPEYLEFVSMEFVSDTEVKLVSTNLQISISSILHLSAPCESFDPVLVHKADLSHLVAICKDQITLDTDKAKATCGKINLSLKVLDAKNYPEISSIDAPSEMPIWSEEELEDFIEEIGMPTRWSQMGITDDKVMRDSADTCVLTPGCCKKFTRDEIFEILKERM